MKTKRDLGGVWHIASMTRYRFAFVLFLLLPVKQALADDTVWYRSAKADGQETRRGGTILDYRGDGLRLRTLAGREMQIPHENVIRVEYVKSPAEQQGDAAFARKDYDAALKHYEVALRGSGESDTRPNKQRDWVRAELVAAQLRCQVALGDYDDAGTLFVKLAKRDADTIHLPLIPLAWTSEASVGERRARSWSRTTDAPAVKLLVASHLLRTPRRATALGELEQLTQSEDLDVARLAMAQRWLTQVPTASVQDLARWNATVEKMPPKLRAGPYYVLGRGYAATGQYEPAALALMRVPILFPHRRLMAAEALLGAGRALTTMKREDEAVRVLREVVADYPDSFAAKEAKQRLEQLGKGS